MIEEDGYDEYLYGWDSCSPLKQIDSSAYFIVKANRARFADLNDDQWQELIKINLFKFEVLCQRGNLPKSFLRPFKRQELEVFVNDDENWLEFLRIYTKYFKNQSFNFFELVYNFGRKWEWGSECDELRKKGLDAVITDLKTNYNNDLNHSVLFDYKAENFITMSAEEKHDLFEAALFGYSISFGESLTKIFKALDSGSHNIPSDLLSKFNEKLFEVIKQKVSDGGRVTEILTTDYNISKIFGSERRKELIQLAIQNFRLIDSDITNLNKTLAKTNFSYLSNNEWENLKTEYLRNLDIYVYNSSISDTKQTLVNIINTGKNYFFDLKLSDEHWRMIKEKLESYVFSNVGIRDMIKFFFKGDLNELNLGQLDLSDKIIIELTINAFIGRISLIKDDRRCFCKVVQDKNQKPEFIDCYFSEMIEALTRDNCLGLTEDQWQRVASVAIEQRIKQLLSDDDFSNSFIEVLRFNKDDYGFNDNEKWAEYQNQAYNKLLENHDSDDYSLLSENIFKKLLYGRYDDLLRNMGEDRRDNLYLRILESELLKNFCDKETWEILTTLTRDDFKFFNNEVFDLFRSLCFRKLNNDMINRDFKLAIQLLGSKSSVITLFNYSESEWLELMKSCYLRVLYYLSNAKYNREYCDKIFELIFSFLESTNKNEYNQKSELITKITQLIIDMIFDLKEDFLIPINIPVKSFNLLTVNEQQELFNAVKNEMFKRVKYSLKIAMNFLFTDPIKNYPELLTEADYQKLITDSIDTINEESSNSIKFCKQSNLDAVYCKIGRDRAEELKQLHLKNVKDFFTRNRSEAIKFLHNSKRSEFLAEITDSEWAELIHIAAQQYNHYFDKDMERAKCFLLNTENEERLTVRSKVNNDDYQTIISLAVHYYELYLRNDDNYLTFFNSVFPESFVEEVQDKYDNFVMAAYDGYRQNLSNDVNECWKIFCNGLKKDISNMLTSCQIDGLKELVLSNFIKVIKSNGELARGKMYNEITVGNFTFLPGDENDYPAKITEIIDAGEIGLRKYLDMNYYHNSRFLECFKDTELQKNLGSARTENLRRQAFEGYKKSIEKGDSSVFEILMDLTKIKNLAITDIELKELYEIITIMVRKKLLESNSIIEARKFIFDISVSNVKEVIPETKLGEIVELAFKKIKLYITGSDSNHHTFNNLSDTLLSEDQLAELLFLSNLLKSEKSLGAFYRQGNFTDLSLEEEVDYEYGGITPERILVKGSPVSEKLDGFKLLDFVKVEEYMKLFLSDLENCQSQDDCVALIVSNWEDDLQKWWGKAVGEFSRQFMMEYIRNNNRHDALFFLGDAIEKFKSISPEALKSLQTLMLQARTQTEHDERDKLKILRDNLGHFKSEWYAEFEKNQCFGQLEAFVKQVELKRKFDNQQMEDRFEGLRESNPELYEYGKTLIVHPTASFTSTSEFLFDPEKLFSRTGGHNWERKLIKAVSPNRWLEVGMDGCKIDLTAAQIRDALVRGELDNLSPFPRDRSYETSMVIADEKCKRGIRQKRKWELIIKKYTFELLQKILGGDKELKRLINKQKRHFLRKQWEILSIIKSFGEDALTYLRAQDLGNKVNSSEVKNKIFEMQKIDCEINPDLLLLTSDCGNSELQRLEQLLQYLRMEFKEKSIERDIWESRIDEMKKDIRITPSMIAKRLGQKISEINFSGETVYQRNLQKILSLLLIEKVELTGRKVSVRIELLPKSDVRFRTLGNDSDCCMRAGSAIHVGYSFIPGIGAVTISFITEEKGKEKSVLLTQSILTKGIDTGATISKEKLLKALRSSGNFSEFLQDQTGLNEKEALTKYLVVFYTNPVLVCDNLEGEKKLVEKLLRKGSNNIEETVVTMLVNFLRENFPTYKINLGKEYSDYGSSLPSEKNEYCPGVIPGYSDNVGSTSWVISGERQQEIPRGSMEISDLSGDETLPMVVLQRLAYLYNDEGDNTSKESFFEDPTDLQAVIYGIMAKCAYEGYPSLAFGVKNEAGVRVGYMYVLPSEDNKLYVYEIGMHPDYKSRKIVRHKKNGKIITENSNAELLDQINNDPNSEFEITIPSALLMEELFKRIKSDKRLAQQTLVAKCRRRSYRFVEKYAKENEYEVIVVKDVEYAGETMKYVELKGGSSVSKPKKVTKLIRGLFEGVIKQKDNNNIDLRSATDEELIAILKGFDQLSAYNQSSIIDQGEEIGEERILRILKALDSNTMEMLKSYLPREIESSISEYL